MSCEHHWHDEGIWEFCCECNAHKCEAIERVRELCEEYKSYSSAQILDIDFGSKILQALDGEQ